MSTKRRHVYLSYSYHLGTLVELVARAMKDAGIDVWLDRWDICCGSTWSSPIHDAIVNANAIMVFIGPEGLARWQEEEVKLALSQLGAHDMRIVPVVTPGVSSDSIPASLRNYRCLDLRKLHPATLQKALADLRRALSKADSSAAGPKVFLSHAQEDKPRVKRIFSALQARGMLPWYDEQGLLAGDCWKEDVIDAIKESDFFALFLSNAAIRKRGFIQKEIREAIGEFQRRPHGLAYILPVRLDDCEVPPVRLDENTTLRDLQWIDVHRVDSRSVNNLAAAIWRQWSKLDVKED